MPTLPLVEWLDRFAVGLRFLLEGVSLVCVALGFAATLRLAVRQRLGPGRGRDALSQRFNSLRLTFGSWLSMALEFQLAGDIVATTTAPSNQNLIQLGVIAVIRTFLNVFLGREVELEMKFEESQRQQREQRSTTESLSP
ncbi:DUF1622 domain-containing protein [Cyanobium gracile]|uniref:Putative membrane protein n=1 Tax=Cyanobium gracile (strain ATCC 27147 / PCC 6307) TaxID=292564 RepID=K9P736_CYAGP|nr:DUF1622 domain-containing protein [Cyanobium gracile]AFY28541.1 putative membrane protein [Cyanobium gracile PCC 6307]